MDLGSNKSRKDTRAVVSLVARYRSPSTFEYVQEACCDVSVGGMFIQSQDPAAPGTLLKLECEADQSGSKIRGVARVVWLRLEANEYGPSGMGVKFVKLEPGSKDIITRVVQELAAAGIHAGSISTAPEQRSKPPSARSSVPAGPAAESQPPSRENSVVPAPSIIVRDSIVHDSELASARVTPAIAVSPVQASAEASAGLGSVQALQQDHVDLRHPIVLATPHPVRDEDEDDGFPGEEKDDAPEPAGARRFPIGGKMLGLAAAALIGIIIFEVGIRRREEPAAAATAQTEPAPPAAIVRSAAPPATTTTQAAVQQEPPPTPPPAPAAALAQPEAAPAAPTPAPEPKPEPAAAEAAAPAPPPAEPSQPPQPPQPSEAARDPKTGIAPPPVHPALAPGEVPYILTFVSKPAGATVTIRDQTITTPGEMDIGAFKARQRVVVEKPGYESSSIWLENVEFARSGEAMRRRLYFILPALPGTPEAAEEAAAKAKAAAKAVAKPSPAPAKPNPAPVAAQPAAPKAAAPNLNGAPLKPPPAAAKNAVAPGKNPADAASSAKPH